MRPFLLSLLMTALLFSCAKETASEQNQVDLHLASSTMPSSAKQGQVMQVQVRYSIPNPCYRFSHFDIRESGSRTYEIRAKAEASGQAVCPQVIVRLDTTVSITPPSAGTYVLRFLRKDEVMKEETVVVQ